MDYTGASRTNLFEVKDLDTFADDLATYNDPDEGIWQNIADIDIEENENMPNHICLFSSDGFWSGGNFTDDDEYPFKDVFALVAAHLVETSAAVFFSVGAEGFRYLQGQAIAVNHKNERAIVDLDDIFDLATKLTDVKTVNLI